MKRSFILLSLLMGLAAQLWAAPVGRTQALKNAQSFLQQRGLAGQTRLQYKAPRNAQSQDDAAAYYIFNIGNNQGFVVVSGDDRTEQVLGYADNGTFDELHMPSNMKAWLQSYADQIQALDRQGVTTAQRAPRKSPTRRSIAPLVTAHWNQKAPYNNQCPIISGSHCVTGCVATAMAQIVYYHREKSKENNFYQLAASIPSYTGEDTGVWVDGFNKDESSLDWDNMRDTYDGSESDNLINAVAYLMAYCGASVEMNYSPNSSGASSRRVASALKNYFGYDAQTRTVVRSQYDISSWNNMIYNELREGRPVLYSGDSGSGVGHAFVVDGYDVDGYFHINWGWAGLSDGYFLLAACEPESSGIGGAESGDGYSIDQDAVVGAQPDAGNEGFDEKVLDAISPSVDGNTITFYCFINRTGHTNSYNLGIGYVDANGVPQLFKKWDYIASPLKDQATFDNMSFTLNASDFAAKGLTTGVYNIVPMCQVGDDGEWLRCNMRAAVIEAQYDAEAGTVSFDVHEPTVSLEATDFEFNGNNVADEKQPVSFKITNNGDEFNGIIYLFANGPGTSSKYESRTGVAAAKGATTVVNMSFEPLAAGTFQIMISTDEKRKNIIGSTSVVIVEEMPQITLELIDCQVENYENIGYTGLYNILGNRMAGMLTIQNTSTNDYRGDLTLRAWDQTENNGMPLASKSMLIDIAAGEQLVVPFDFRGLTYNHQHNICIYYDDGSYFGDIIPTGNYIPQPAVMITHVDGTMSAVRASSDATLQIPSDAVVIDMTGVASDVGDVQYDGKENPNILYLIGEDEWTPGAVWEKNVVIGSTAESITIIDGHDFVVPKAINAESVYYKRTFEIGTDAQGTGWQTIVLPFSPTEIRGEYNCDLDWFHSRSDVDKDFWLMEFSESVGSQVIFDYAQSFDANIPYIIAVPDDSWGSDWDLRNQEITFMGENVTLLPTSSSAVGSDVYKFVGTMQQQTLESAYLLNDEGSRFASVENSVEQPFRAYFEPKTALTSMPQALSIGFFNDNTTAIAMPQIVSGQAAVYNLQGVRVAIVPVAAGQADLSTLPKGVYIVNGKKVIK